jgi:hypothetical protein
MVNDVQVTPGRIRIPASLHGRELNPDRSALLATHLIHRHAKASYRRSRRSQSAYFVSALGDSSSSSALVAAEDEELSETAKRTVARAHAQRGPANRVVAPLAPLPTCQGRRGL